MAQDLGDLQSSNEIEISQVQHYQVLTLRTISIAEGSSGNYQYN